MIVSIFGTNGMLSSFITKYFFQQGHIVNTFGIEKPSVDCYTNFQYLDLANSDIDYSVLIKSDLVVFAAGAGVQADKQTDTSLIYKINLCSPIEICNSLKKFEYKGIYISFGSYMEIGLNDNENFYFDEKQVELSDLPVNNDYALSKRLLTRFMSNLQSSYKFWHFILPNIFFKDEPGTRLIPYVLNYLERSKRGEVCEIPRFSSGDQIRQYVNFNDVCYLIMRCIDSDIKSGVYNIGGGEVLSIKELIIRLFNHYNVPVFPGMFGKAIRRDNDIRSLKLNCEKLKKELGYMPHNQIESIFQHGTDK